MSFPWAAMMDGSTCLVTGISGFVGGRVGLRLAEGGRTVRGAIRGGSAEFAGHEQVIVGDLSEATDWSEALQGIDCVIHCAAQTRLSGGDPASARTALRKVNVDATRSLAEQAAALRVRRLVFVSSVKVNGERTAPGRPFSPSDPTSPEDAYGQSKLDAENALREISARTGMELVIVRPPLVYGAQATGNFARLMRMVARGLPLPLGAVDNRRSLVFIENLVDVLVRCVDHPDAARHTFLVSDGEDLSTPELFRRLAKAMDRRVYMLPVPISILRTGGRLTGLGDEIDRLTGSLQVDISRTCDVLDWQPPVRLDQALKDTALGFLASTQEPA